MKKTKKIQDPAFFLQNKTFFFTKIITLLVFVFFLIFQNISFAQTEQTTNKQEDKCNSCYITSKYITNRDNFTKEIANILEIKNFSRHEELKWPNWLFSLWVLKAPDNPNYSKKDIKRYFSTLKKRIKENYSTVIQSIAITTTILAKLTFSLDFVANVRVVLRYPAPIVRDYKKILKIDKRIWDLLFDLWTYWKLDEILSLNQINKIQEISKKYEWKHWLFDKDWVSIGAWATFGQTIKVLRKINNKFKTFMTLNKISQFWDENDIKEVSKWNIYIKLSPNLWKEIKENYDCVRWIFKCKNWYKLFMDNLSSIRQDIKKSAKDFYLKFPQEAKRLYKTLQWTLVNIDKLKPTDCDFVKKTFLLNWKTYSVKGRDRIDPDTQFEYIYYKDWDKRYQVELTTKDNLNIWKQSLVNQSLVYTNCKFRSRKMAQDPEDQKRIEKYLEKENQMLITQFRKYINASKEDPTLIWQWIKLLKNSINRASILEQEINSNLKDFESNINEEYKQVDNVYNETNYLRSVLKWVSNKDIDDIDLRVKNNLLDLKNQLSQSIQSTIQEHQEVLWITIISDTTDITKAIWQMVQQVRYNTDLIENKDNPSSLINNLWKACEWQCANRWWKCRSE